MKRTLMVFIGIFFLFLIFFNQKGIGGIYLKNSLGNTDFYEFRYLTNFKVKRQIYDYSITQSVYHEDYGYSGEFSRGLCGIKVYQVQHSLPKNTDFALELNRQEAFSNGFFTTILRQQPDMDLMLVFTHDENELWSVDSAWLNIKYLKLLLSNPNFIMENVIKLTNKPLETSVTTDYFPYKLRHSVMANSVGLDNEILHRCSKEHHTHSISNLDLLLEEENVIFPYSKNEMQSIVAKTLSHPKSIIYFQANRDYFSDKNTLPYKSGWIFNAEIGYLIRIFI